MKFRDEEGILNAVEIDGTQMMHVNSEKMNRYGEFTTYYKESIMVRCQLFIFTLTEYRQKR